MGRRRTGGIQQRGDSWRISYTAEGKRHFETFLTREDAERELKIRVADEARGLPVSSEPHTVTFLELAADVINDYRVNKRKSIEDIKARFRLHINPFFGSYRAASITTAQINDYILRRRKEEYRGTFPSTGTINRELEAIRHTFQMALRDERILRAPHVPHLQESNVRTGFFTRAEVDRLCVHLKPPLRQMVLFAFLTGWRLGEIRNLRWSNVDFEHAEIRLDPGSTKNGKGRVFPMSAELRGLLDTAKTWRNTTPARNVKFEKVAAITPNVFTRARRPVGEFRKSWATACIKAGFCAPGPGGKPRANRIFHDLRRSAAKNLVAQGNPERVVMEMCGWLTRSVFDRYSVVGQSDLNTARERMDAAAGIAPETPLKSAKTTG